MVATELQADKTILKRFAVLLAKERLGHAYLFVGPQDVGKSAAALAVAKLVNCEGALGQSGMYCDECPSCRKINSGSHPDVTIIDAGEELSIKIAVIRELLSKIQLRSFAARRKVFIIHDAEKITLEGTNALLKTLEEPNKDSLLLLTSSAPEKLLDTVRSRCQAIQLFPYSQQKLQAQLRGKFAIEAQEASFLAFFTEGCLGKAKRLNAEKFFLRKNEIIDNIVFRRNLEAFQKVILADKNKTKESLEVLLSWFKDLALFKAGATEDCLTHSDRLADLQKEAGSYSFKLLREIIEVIVNALKLLNDNLNVKIPFNLLTEKIWVKSYKSS